MKPKIPRFLFSVLCFLLCCFGCDKDYDDYPGVSIYKTNGDYFNLVDIGMKSDKIFRRDSYLTDSSKIKVTESDTIYKHRIKLINGYILDWEADEKYDVFLNLSFKHHIILEAKYGTICLSNDTLMKYIIDKSPYIEFYRETEVPKRFTHPDTSQINEIIRNGQIEQYFERLK